MVTPTRKKEERRGGDASLGGLAGRVAGARGNQDGGVYAAELTTTSSTSCGSYELGGLYRIIYY